MIKKLLSVFKKPEQIQYQGEIAPWDDSDAVALYEFLKSDTGSHFLKHLKAHQSEVTQWATDVSMENYDNMKFRACVAHGVKLGVDKILSMSTIKPRSKHEKASKETMDNFFNRRMGMFKS